MVLERGEVRSSEENTLGEQGGAIVLAMVVYQGMAQQQHGVW